MRGRVLMTATAIVVVAACSNSTTYGGGGGGGGSGGRTTNLTVRDNSFSPTPDTISISAGPTATWTWSGTANQHSVTFEHNVMSSGLRSSGTHQRTFSAAGQYRYRCTNHSASFGTGMSGTIVVIP